MRISKHPIDMCVLKGSWLEMGRQYGEDCKEDIAFMIDWWNGCFKSWNKNFNHDEAAADCAKRFGGPIKEYSPKAYDFIEGIAEGAGVSFESILLINAAADYMGGTTEMSSGNKPEVCGCTTFAIDNKHTRDGKTIIAQNVDWHDNPINIVLQFNPTDGPRSLGLAFPGSCPQNGMSENGYGVCINSVLTERCQDGVPMYVIILEAISGNAMSPSIDKMLGANRSMAFNYMFANHDGIILDIETTIDDDQPIEKKNGFIVHTNNYQTPRFQVFDLGKHYSDSYARHEIASQLIEEGGSNIDIEYVKGILRDHHGTALNGEDGLPCCICCHSPKDAPYYASYASILSVIYVPEDGVAYASNRPEEEFTKYSL